MAVQITGWVDYRPWQYKLQGGWTIDHGSTDLQGGWTIDHGSTNYRVGGL